MLVDYDFILGRQHYRGNGWRGLVALGMILVLRAVIFTILAIEARPGAVWLSHWAQRLLGT